MLLVAIGAQGSANALEPDILFARVSPSVWSLRALDAQERPLQTGSAVVVAPGRLITSCRLLAKASSVIVRQDNVSYGATLEFPDPVRDLCQLSVARFSAPAVPMAPVGSARPGQRVYAVGNPRGVENTLSIGLLSGLRGGDSEEARRLQTTVATAVGASGGGLFDSEGRLLGILVADGAPGDATAGSAIPAEFVTELPARARAVLEARAAAPSVAATPATVVAPLPSVGGAEKVTDPLRPGQALEYLRIDYLTGNRAPVIYRLDHIVGDEMVFNGGGRIEKTDGRVVSVVSPAGGIYDASTPPGGWVRKDMRPGMRWSADYVPAQGDRWRHELNFTVVGERSKTVDGVELRLMQVSFEGWIYSSFSTAPSRTGKQFSGSLLYSAALGRVVQFEAKSYLGATPTRETLEFVRTLR
ncbi:MAG TPA: serine protease [Hyphomicrobiaceae bacterium]|nr:serine protease [Hyphomicrobiaceae bacterium]